MPQAGVWPRAGSFSWLSGWTGGLRLLGGRGADRLRGERGFDELRGGTGADEIVGGPGDDEILGGPGPDRIEAGPGSDSIDSGPAADRIRSVDRSSDTVDCRDGRDRARLDGFDLPEDCERRRLSSVARAVATRAAVSNDYGESDDHLEVSAACPIDARKGCRATVAARVPGEGTISRRLRLAPGCSKVLRMWTRTYSSLERVTQRGIRVTVRTRVGGRPALEFTERLLAPDDRYNGE